MIRHDRLLSYYYRCWLEIHPICSIAKFSKNACWCRKFQTASKCSPSLRIHVCEFQNSSHSYNEKYDELEPGNELVLDPRFYSKSQVTFGIHVRNHKTARIRILPKARTLRPMEWYFTASHRSLLDTSALIGKKITWKHCSGGLRLAALLTGYWLFCYRQWQQKQERVTTP